MGGDNGRKMVMLQTARPSWLFDLMSLGGRFGAQERDWGFVLPYGDDFQNKDVALKALTVFHEFVHQSKQIHERGVVKYWTNYSFEYFTRDYNAISMEKEVYRMEDELRKFMRNDYGIAFE